ncbi:MAG: DUF1822 family protein [Xenococcaceae cyanobacterium MO_167.B27]|nr:DUF1822 family protein [Xenococcaceae cyanobacterium MO_167.B27]
MAVLKINCPIPNETIRSITQRLGLTETTASQGQVKVYIFHGNISDLFSRKEKLESAQFKDYLTLIDIGLAPEFKLVPVSETDKDCFSIVQWLDTGVSAVAAEIGWVLDNGASIVEGAKFVDVKEKKDSGTTSNKIVQRYKLPLIIAGTNYELIVSLVDEINHEWKIALINAKAGGQIPPGFKLRLLDQNGKGFENNEAEIIEVGDTEIYIKVQLEAEEGLIWEVEPMPENYHRYVMYF